MSARRAGGGAERQARAPAAAAAPDPSRWLRGLVVVALLLTPAIFVPGLVEGFEMPKAGVVRVCGFGAAALLIASWRARRPTLRPLDLAVLAWLGVELLATAASRAPWISLVGDRSQHEGLLTSLALAALYFATRATVRDAAGTRALRIAFVAGMAAAALYAVLQLAHLDPLGWQRTATYGAAAQLRPFGTLGHANMLGPLTAAGVIAALSLARGLRGGRRLLGGAAAALFAAVTFATLSRGAWIGLAVGVATTVMAIGREPGAASAPRRRGVAIGAALILGAIALAAANGWGRLVAARLGEAFSGGSSRSRLEIWRTALAMAADRPWIGQGPDTFGLRFPTFQTRDYWRFEWGGLPVHAHSIYLHALATRGVAGVLAGAGLLVAWILTARRALRAGSEARAVTAGLAGITLCLAAAGAFGALGITGALLLAVAGGSTASLAEAPAGRLARPLPDGRTEARRPGRGPGIAGGRVALAAAAAVMALALAGLAIEVLAERAAWQAWLELTAGAEGDRSLAARSSARAWAMMPRQDGYGLLHAQCLLALAGGPGDFGSALTAAEHAARDAVRRAPLRAANAQVLAFTLGERAARGDARAAAELGAAWARAHELAPYDAESLLQDADQEIHVGRAAAALALARRAAALYPDDGPTLFRLSGAEGWAGDSLAAVATLERAVSADWRGDEAFRQSAAAALDSVRRLSRSR